MEYKGDEINIAEWPNGAEIYDNKNNFIKVQSPRDAEAIIESLTRYLLTFKDKGNETKTS